eukprot:gb/GECH01009394.1/.p1 GENE.gb/GECH01009394.1/~~gb/GECH01009394.1/.p1  ORF type:complete len:688 (+),score=166.31 gb/GECH01009394.1/:1-2064(+)
MNSSITNRVAVLTRHLLDSDNHYTSYSTPSFATTKTTKSSQNTTTQHITLNQQSKNETTASIDIKDEIQKALESNGPVVALESTIISHGMPYPQNLETAQQVEEEIRRWGAIPATIAVLNGRIKVGLEEHELNLLASLGSSVRKCSRRDLALVCAENGNGATTVAGTLFVASKVGIPVFVTGGIGGVHRGVEETMDVSADLTELGRSGGVAVVCAGAKSILDIPRTLEYLETQGVTVASWKSDRFPAFFSPDSGCQASCRLDSFESAARLIQSNKKLRMESGIVIGVPIPSEHAKETKHIERAINKALKEAKRKKISGKDSTPFLLRRVNELTEGKSLEANIKLVLNNSAIGAQIAVASAKIEDRIKKYRTVNPKVLVVGGTLVDLISRPGPGHRLLFRDSTPGQLDISFGGVARNITEALLKLECPTAFLSAVGQDPWGEQAIDKLCAAGTAMSSHKNMFTDRIVRQPGSPGTACWSAILNEDGDLAASVASTDILHTAIVPHLMQENKDLFSSLEMVVCDSNISDDMLIAVSNECYKMNMPLFFEPTSAEKSIKPIQCGILDRITYLKPNETEAKFMASHIRDSTVTSVEEAVKILIHGGIQHVLCSRGKKGLIYATKRGSDSPHLETYPAPHVPQVINTTGAGDSLSAGFIASLVQHNDINTSILAGLESAGRTLQCSESVFSI